MKCRVALLLYTIDDRMRLGDEILMEVSSMMHLQRGGDQFLYL
jgi:hypothetical protein